VSSDYWCLPAACPWSCRRAGVALPCGRTAAPCKKSRPNRHRQSLRRKPAAIHPLPNPKSPPGKPPTPVRNLRPRRRPILAAVTFSKRSCLSTTAQFLNCRRQLCPRLRWTFRETCLGSRLPVLAKVLAPLLLFTSSTAFGCVNCCALKAKLFCRPVDRAR
jgi:hypothetical protein